MQILNDEEKEKLKSAGLFEVLSEKFKLQHNKQYCHYNIANRQGNRMKMLRNGWIAKDLKQMIMVTKKEIKA